MAAFDTIDGTYCTSQNVQVHPCTYGYAFINKGDTGVQINGTYLKPYPAGRPDLSGESFMYVDPLEHHLSKTNFIVIFDAAPGVAPQLEIHQVHHVNTL